MIVSGGVFVWCVFVTFGISFISLLLMMTMYMSLKNKMNIEEAEETQRFRRVEFLDFKKAMALQKNELIDSLCSDRKQLDDKINKLSDIVSSRELQRVSR